MKADYGIIFLKQKKKKVNRSKASIWNGLRDSLMWKKAYNHVTYQSFFLLGLLLNLIRGVQWAASQSAWD